MTRRETQRWTVRLLLATAAVVLCLPAPAGAYVYWSHYNLGTIGRADNDGTHINNGFITGLDHPTHLAVDDTYIYWAESSSIGRARLDGTGVNRTFIPNVFPCGVAVSATHVYWGQYSNPGAIGRASIDGTGVNTSFIPGGAGPCGPAVSPTHIYWGNYYVGATTLGRATTGGATVNQNFIAGSDRPFSVAVNGTHVYWGTRGANPRVGRANLDGSAPNHGFINPAPWSMAAIALHDTWVYWANVNGAGVGRARLDGSSVTPQFINGATDSVLGVAVDARPLPPPPPPVTPPNPPALDGDADGIGDASDACPTTPRGIFDADNNGCPGPYSRINARIRSAWVVSAKEVTLTRVRLVGLPKGATVQVRCPSCNVRQRLTATRSRLALKKLRGKRLRRGATFTIRITKLGYVGQVITRKVKPYGRSRAAILRAARDPFRERERCIPVGATVTAKRCSSTPPAGP